MEQSHLHLDSDSYGAGAESSNVKNVLVLGGSYGGMHAASVLANKLPPSHRVILIERNSHFNHLYAFPRFSVLPGHAHKAFIPYSHIFRDSPARRQSRKKAKTNLQDQSEGPSLRLQSKSKRRSSESLDSSTNSKSEVEGSISSKTSNSSPSTAATELGESWSEARLESASSKAGAVGIATSIAREGSNVVEKNQNQAERPPIVVEDLKEALESGDGAEHLTQGITAVEEKNEEEDPESESDEGVEAAPHIVLQASVTRITDTHVLVTPQANRNTSQAEQKKKLWGIDSLSIPYTHLIYALGSHLPDPLRSEARTKSEGISWMESMQNRIRESQKIVLVGGGPLGVQLATDIASTYSKEDEKKQITLIHSRKQLLPNFDFKIHEIALERLKELGVNVVLGERLATTEGCPRGSGVKEEHSTSNANLPRNTSPPKSSDLPPLLPHQKRITTTSGSNFTADLLLLCTGQQPSSSILADFSPSSVDPSSRLIRVRPTLQIALPERDEGLLSQMPFDFKAPCGDCDCFLDKKVAGKDQDEGSNSNETREGEKKKHTLCFTNMYAIGDVANAFGALNAGYQAWAMADIAAGNILLDIQSSSSTQDQDPDRTSEDSETALKPLTFVPAPNLLKLSLGLGKVAHQGAPVKKVEGEGSNRVEIEEVPVEVKEEDEDLGVKLVWQYMALAPTEDMHL